MHNIEWGHVTYHHEGGIMAVMVISWHVNGGFVLVLNSYVETGTKISRSAF